MLHFSHRISMKIIHCPSIDLQDSDAGLAKPFSGIFEAAITMSALSTDDVLEWTPRRCKPTK